MRFPFLKNYYRRRTVVVFVVVNGVRYEKEPSRVSRS